MRTIRKTAFKAFLVMLVVSSTTSIGMAQFASEATIRDTIRRIQTRTDSLQRAAQLWTTAATTALKISIV